MPASDEGVDLSRRQPFMPRKLLQAAKVGPILHHQRRGRMAKQMAAATFGDPICVQMAAARMAGAQVLSADRLRRGSSSHDRSDVLPLFDDFASVDGHHLQQCAW